MLSLSFTRVAIVALISAFSLLPLRGNALASYAHDPFSRESIHLTSTSRELNPPLDATGAALRKRSQQTVHLPNAATRARILHRTNSLPDRLSHLPPPSPRDEHAQAEQLRRAAQTARREAYERRQANIQLTSKVCRLIHQRLKIRYLDYCRKATAAGHRSIRSLDERDKIHAEHHILAPDEDHGFGMVEVPSQPNKKMAIAYQKISQLNSEADEHWAENSRRSERAHRAKLESDAFKEGFKHLWDPRVHIKDRFVLLTYSPGSWYSARARDYQPIRRARTTRVHRRPGGPTIEGSHPRWGSRRSWESHTSSESRRSWE